MFSAVSALCMTALSVASLQKVKKQRASIVDLAQLPDNTPERNIHNNNAGVGNKGADGGVNLPPPAHPQDPADPSLKPSLNHWWSMLLTSWPVHTPEEGHRLRISS